MINVFSKKGFPIFEQWFNNETLCKNKGGGRLFIFKISFLDIYLKCGHFCGKTDQQTDRQTDSVVYREVTLPKIVCLIGMVYLLEFVVYYNAKNKY